MSSKTLYTRASTGLLRVTTLVNSSLMRRQNLCAVMQVPDVQNDADGIATGALNTVMLNALKPKEIVNELDKHIVGQAFAKRAVAIALRNRWRRKQLSEDFRGEVIPKNILMVGPTGCGKTEIARRIAKLSQAPFIKVEATKFTEVGFHGKDVDQIVKDLLDISINMTKKRIKQELKDSAAENVEDKLLDCLEKTKESTRDTYRECLREGTLEDKVIEIEVQSKRNDNFNSDFRPIPFDVNQGQSDAFAKNFFHITGGQPVLERKKVSVKEAREIFEDSECEQLMEEYDVAKEAITSVEESGIIFIDEIDKLARTGDYRGTDASSEGVQRDLLPLIEGTTVTTKHGNVNTDFILFVASGAFHSSKPSDLLAELQGRLPIRVTLGGLTEEDLYRVLTEPITNLIYQQIQMLKSERIKIDFTDESIREIARIAFEANRSIENIGARRLHAVIEKVMEEISFDAPDKEAGEVITVDKDYVKNRIGNMLLSSDLRKYIL